MLVLLVTSDTTSVSSRVTYPGAGASGDFSETYLGLDIMGIDLTYAAGDEFGDYAEISYGFDAGPGSSAFLMETMKIKELTI